MRSFFIVLIGLALLQGCASQTYKPLYYWGNYQEVLYQSLTSPEKKSPEAEIKILLDDLKNAKKTKLKTPPGFRAHLGYLFMMAGDSDSAYNYFEEEAEAFPESRVLMDRFLGRKKKVKQ